VKCEIQGRLTLIMRTHTFQRSRHGSVSVVTRPLAGWLGFDCRHGQGFFFLFVTASTPALGPTRPPIQRVAGAPSPGIMRLRREAAHSFPSSAEVKKAWSYTYTLPYIHIHGVVLKHRTRLHGVVLS